ncbi:GntR family transcriptional regulator [Paracoccus tibetensis]|nr:GntR family transcriptional regulator [Paracoccus tibetensis]
MRPMLRTKSEKIANVLEAEIRSGSLLDGDALSSESALVERFSVSRSTVRKGLGILAAKGLIRTKVGIGSFVTYGGTVIDSGPGWSLALADAGTRMGTRILTIARQPMELDAPDFSDAEVLAVDRLRFLQDTGRALTLERSRVPWRDDFEPILTQGLQDGSLSRTLEAQRLSPAAGEEWANVLPALGPRDAALMGREPGEPMLHLRRLTRTAAGDVAEYVESLLDPMLFGLHMRF